MNRFVSIFLFRVIPRKNMFNNLIRLLSRFTKPIDGDPSIWYERPWPQDPSWRDFKCGSVRGLYRVKDKTFEILAVQNTKKNDNFNIVLNWFHKSAEREKYDVAFLEVGNYRLWSKLGKFGYSGTQERLVKKFKT